jgi:hypothetical protein
MNIVTNAETPWKCFKDPNSKLVYWVHSKCACTFYQKIFKKLKWKETTTVDVDWDHDIIFSYIRDPLVKQRIGVIEWFFNNYKYNSLLKDNANNEEFFIMLSQIPYLDWHSLSILEHLGKENSLKVNWIPVDQPSVNHLQQTVNLLLQHTTIAEDTKEWILTQDPIHVSSGFKKQCNQKLLDILPTPLIIKSIEHDRWLYDKITKKNFEPDNYAQQINYLKSLGLTTAQAELQADQDVETGEYLNWN